MTKASEAQARYDAENTVKICLKFNKKTDADILEMLNKAPSKQGLIKEALRKFSANFR